MNSKLCQSAFDNSSNMCCDDALLEEDSFLIDLHYVDWNDIAQDEEKDKHVKEECRYPIIQNDESDAENINDDIIKDDFIDLYYFKTEYDNKLPSLDATITLTLSN